MDVGVTLTLLSVIHQTRRKGIVTVFSKLHFIKYKKKNEVITVGNFPEKYTLHTFIIYLKTNNIISNTLI